MRDELIEKLNRLLHDRTTFSEAEVVYLLVESRKLLDRQREEGENGFHLIRFYADWSVHTEKSRSLEAIKAIAEQIAASPAQSVGDVTRPEQRHPHLDFAYMTALRAELDTFLQHFDIENPFTSEEVWINFVRSLAAVLHEQPIENPIPAIAEIRFETSVSGSAEWVVTFTDGRAPVKLGSFF